MRLQFLGAAGTVTGSGYLLSGGTVSILIDFGMFQGGKDVTDLNFRPLSFDPTRISHVLLTHAHLDHCGRIPVLVKNGFSGSIIMTQPTRDLIEITLLDAAKIAEENEEGHVLYTESDVAQVMTQAESVAYEQPFHIGPFEVRYRDAGHILGSAFIEIFDGESKRKIVFSGDLGNTPEDLVRPTETERQADYVLLESTYGDRTHTKENPPEVITEEIRAIEASGGALLIPAFSIERAQELLHILDHLKRKGDVPDSLPVYLDSPMAIAVTDVYKRFRNLYSKELAAHSSFDDPFAFPGLVSVQKVEESKHILKDEGPKVIIAGSGMMTGGRILHHAALYLPHERNRLLFVGFQAEGTIGREILEGAKEISLYGRTIPVRAHIRKSSGLSAHADQPKLISWFSRIQGVSHLFLVHGEDPARHTLAEKIRSLALSPRITLPVLDQEVVLAGSDKGA